MSGLEKEKLILACKSLFIERMNETEKAMLAAQESANSNEKSSMGDKYETGRAMGQLERDRLAKQLALLQDDYAQLAKINPSISHLQVESGALVQTENHWYLIAVSMGSVTLENQKVMVVSTQSPIAKAMWGLKKGGFFEMNGNKQKIIAVY